MFAKERQFEILALLRADGAVSVSALVERFDVSIETVRRDLLHLEQQNLLQRVHGGAVLPGKITQVSRLEERVEENKCGKEELSEIAANLVCDGDVIYIDSGATARYFAMALKNTKSKLTVVTNSHDVFTLLQDKVDFELILCGGHYMRREQAFYGFLALEMLKNIHVDKAFLIPSAVSLHGGFSEFPQELLSVQKQVLSQCSKLYFLADSQKFERHGLYKLCDLYPSCNIITDSKISQSILSLYREEGINMITKRENEL